MPGVNIAVDQSRASSEGRARHADHGNVDRIRLPQSRPHVMRDVHALGEVHERRSLMEDAGRIGRPANQHDALATKPDSFRTGRTQQLRCQRFN
jgi:hypothetical protein